MVYTRYERLKWFSSLPLGPGVKGSLKGRGAEWSHGWRVKSGRCRFRFNQWTNPNQTPTEQFLKGDGCVSITPTVAKNLNGAIEKRLMKMTKFQKNHKKFFLCT